MGIGENSGFWVFWEWWLVGAFCKIGVSDTGSPVHFLGVFGILRHFRRIRGWYNIVMGFEGWGFVEVVGLLW